MTLGVILSLLIVPWCWGWLVCLVRPSFQAYLPFCGVAGLSLVFLFTAAGHFIRTDAMMEMLPNWVPWKQAVVHLSGLLEAVFAIALLPPRFRSITGWVVICFLLMAYPINVYAAATGRGPGMPDLGVWYLLLRTPVQLVLIAWTYRFAVRRQKNPTDAESDAL